MKTVTDKLPQKRVAFIGDFKKLIPMGYEFGKVFDYRCYYKGDLGSKVWIWVKGKEVELCALYDCSFLIVQEIINGNDFKRRKHDDFSKDIEEILSCTLFIDVENAVFIEKDVYDFKNQYHREFCIHEVIVDIVKGLLKNKMIEIQNYKE